MKSSYIYDCPIIGCTGHRASGALCPNVWALCTDEPNAATAYDRAIEREIAAARVFWRNTGSDWAARRAQEAIHARHDAHMRLTGVRSPDDNGDRR